MSYKATFVLCMAMAIYFAYTEAMFLGLGSSKPKADPSKPESKCNPNPCQKGGNCTLDRSQNAVCACAAGYFGPVCEKKTACNSNPCKNNGSCTPDAVDMEKKYTCKCAAGYLGQKCDKKDKCYKNGPCGKTGTCSLDAKMKPKCACQNGWGSDKCNKRNCTIVQFKGSHFESTPKTFVNKQFAKKLDDVDKLAKLCHVKIKVLKSFTIAATNKTGSRWGLKDETENFYTGSGLEIEILDEKGALVCNSMCLAKTPIPHVNAKCFMDGLNAIRVKHSILKPIIHDGSHLDSKTFDKDREFYQVGCFGNKF